MRTGAGPPLCGEIAPRRNRRRGASPPLQDQRQGEYRRGRGGAGSISCQRPYCEGGPHRQRGDPFRFNVRSLRPQTVRRMDLPSRRTRPGISPPGLQGARYQSGGHFDGQTDGALICGGAWDPQYGRRKPSWSSPRTTRSARRTGEHKIDFKIIELELGCELAQGLLYAAKLPLGEIVVEGASPPLQDQRQGEYRRGRGGAGSISCQRPYCEGGPHRQCEETNLAIEPVG